MKTRILRLVPHSLALVAPLSPIAGALASPPTDAADVLARVREAAGLGALAEHPHGVRASGVAMIGGMSGDYEMFFDASGRSARRLSGPITIEGGYDGARAWVRDLAGEARVLSLGEDDDATVSDSIVTGSWLSPASPFNFTLESASDDACVLSFTLDGSDTTGTIRIDADSWRPLEWTFTDGSVAQTVTLRGSVSGAGLSLPAIIEQTRGEGAVMRVELREVAPAGPESESRYVPDLSPPRDTRFDPSVPAALEVRKAPTGHLLVKPTVNGQDVGWFIFDTGAGANCIASHVVDRLALERFGEVPAVGVGGTTKTAFVRPASLTLGPATLENPLMVILDLKFLEPYMGVEVGGIVGYSFLARTVAELDLAMATIAIHDPAEFEHAALAWTPLTVADRVPCVQATFEDHTGWFRLDTGANSTVTLHAPVVKAHKLIESRETTDTSLGGVGGRVKARKGKLAWFDLGGHRMSDIEAEFATEPTGVFGDADTFGNIGTRLLAPFRLVFDYPNGRIAFIKRESE